MKKRVLFFVNLIALIFIGGGYLAAQNSEYNSLLKKAKDYQAKKEYFYAFATYYDAIEADLLHAQEALEAWQVLKKAFSEGKPGLENSYTDFTLHKGYLDLLKNCDKYWTEFYPQVYCFAFRFEKGDVDYAKETASYEVKIKLCGHSKKFYALMEPIETGLQKAWVEQWKDIPKDYPKESIKYTDAGTGVATYNGIGIIESAYNYKTHSDYVKNVEYRDVYEASWMVNEGDFNLTDIEFNICDQNGKTLVAYPNRILLKKYNGFAYGWSTTATLKNVNASIMELIDSQKVGVKITNMYLYYGKPSYADAVASAAYEEYGKTQYNSCPRSRKFVDHLSALSYKNPKVVSFIGDYFIRDSMIIDIASKVIFAILKAEDEKYTPLEVESFEFVRGDYTFMRYGYGYYYDYYCDANGNYHRTTDVQFASSFYVDKESFNRKNRYYYDSDWNKLNEEDGLPEGTLRKITEGEFWVLKTVHPELKDASYDSYKDYLIVRSASAVTKESLEAENNIPKLEKENKKITYFSDVQKNTTFTVKGKNLSKEILYAQFEGEEEKFYPASVNAEKTAATFIIPVEKIKDRIYFYLNEKKKDFYYDFSERYLKPKISQSSFDLEYGAPNLKFDLDDGAPNLTVGTAFNFENVESAKDSLKFLLNKEEVSIKGIDYTSIILQTADVMNKVGAYKLELFAGNELAKSWDITVTDVIADQFEKWRSGQESLEISGTFAYDINKFDGYSDITISKNNNLRDLLRKKKAKVIIEENSQEISFGYYSSCSVKMPISKKLGEYKIFLEIDGEQIDTGKTVTIADLVADQFEKWRTGEERLEISGTFVYDINKFNGYSDITISKNKNLSDLLETKKIKVIIGENSQEISFEYYSSSSIKMPLPAKVGEYKIFLEMDGEQIESGKTVTITDIVADQLALLKSGKETLEISGTFLYDINKADGNYKTDFTVSRNINLNDLLAKKTVKIVVGEQKTNTLDFYKYDSFKIASLSVPQKAGNYDIIFEIDGEKIKSGKQIFVGDMSDVYIANFTNGVTKVVVNQKSATVAVGAKDAQLTFDFSQVADLFGKKPANVEISIDKDKYKLRVEKKGSAVSAPALKIKVPQTKVDATYDIFVEIAGKRAKVDGVLQVVDYELQSAKSKAKQDGLEFIEVFQTKKGELYAVFNVGENAYKRLTKQNTDTESVYKYLSKKKNMVGNFSAFLDFDLNTSNYINIKDAKGKKVVKEVYRLTNSSDSVCVVAVFLRK